MADLEKKEQIPVLNARRNKPMHCKLISLNYKCSLLLYKEQEIIWTYLILWETPQLITNRCTLMWNNSSQLFYKVLKTSKELFPCHFLCVSLQKCFKERKIGTLAWKKDLWIQQPHLPPLINLSWGPKTGAANRKGKHTINLTGHKSDFYHKMRKKRTCCTNPRNMHLICTKICFDWSNSHKLKTHGPIPQSILQTAQPTSRILILIKKIYGK